MRYNRLGSSGLRVSQIALGMNLFDTADMYDRGASEEVTGQLLSRLFTDRDDYVLATKVYFPMSDGPNGDGLSRKHIMTSVDATLRRLGTDYLDLYQIHRLDPRTPVEETMQALHDVVRAGKVRYLGASSMYAWQFSKAQYTARIAGLTPFASMQNHYNLLYREEEREMLPLCRDLGVGVLPYSPLARGMLAGGRDRGGQRDTVRAGNDPLADDTYTDEDFDIVDAVRAVAARREVAPAQIALAWLLSRPDVTAPIVGSTRLTHLQDAVAATELDLSPEEIARLEAPYRPHPVLGHH